MATTNLTVGDPNSFTYGPGATVVLTKIIDCSVTPLAAADVAQIFDVSRGTWVQKVVVDIIAVDSGASARTFDIGDGTDPDGYIDGGDAKTLAMTGSALTVAEGAPNTVVGFSNGKLYTAADTIDLTAVQALTDCIIKVTVLYANFTN